MLKEIARGCELDNKRLMQFLYEQQLVNQIDSDLKVQQFSNGYSNLTYLLKVEDRELVLRKPPLGAVKRGHDMGREFKVLSKLSPHFEKAPIPYAFEESGDVLGSPFYLMHKIEGIVINYKTALDLNLSAENFLTISDTWLNAFVEFHQLDYKEVGLSDLGKPEGYVERQIKNWSSQYRKASTRDIPSAEIVMNWMNASQPKHYDHTLIHNDYKYDNIVFENGNWNKINAILDWEMCTIGDPLMDLGTSLGYWTMHDDGPAFVKTIISPTLLPGNPSRSEIVQAYTKKSGRAIDNLIFYYVFGLFKIAVIVQQIFYRYNKGLATDEKFAKLDQVCAFLCLTAQQAIDKKRIENLF